jgi:DNA-binding NarL/FixJ family response regulator
MHLEWILSPITQYAVAAAVLLTCLALFLSTTARVAKFQRQNRAVDSSAAADLQALASKVEHVQSSLERIENAPPAPAPRPGMNLNRRTQVLRMYHRGEPVETIASALRTSRNEVELLLKLHGLMGAKLAANERE